MLLKFNVILMTVADRDIKKMRKSHRLIEGEWKRKINDLIYF